ncbi:MAG: glycosyltransferase family 2 protein, partial [Myxococcales bacterium]|nr:glycosyltransferase family 2 protein [Myxococcales bacterium]
MVTIAIPCLNEERWIEACVEQAVGQDYPQDRLEIIVGDGGSQDTTRAILDDLAKKHPNVRWIDNPERIQAAAMNAIIKECRGDVVVRFDAHASYASDYVSRCIEVLERTGADNVGGAQRPIAESVFQRALCAALSSPLGVGGAKYRSADQEGFVDTVWLGAFRRRVFETVGLYDAHAVTNEDAELNQRILQAGGKVYLSPTIEAHYFPRASHASLAKQYFRYGMGRARTLLKHGRFEKLRPALPFAMVATGAVMAITPALRPLLLPCVGGYLAVCAVEGYRVGRQEGPVTAAVTATVFPVL